MSLDTRLTDLAEEIGADVKALREGKANTAHDHDDLYYTKTEVDTELISKVSTTDPRLSDAETLDGQDGSYYRNASNLNTGTIPAARMPTSLTPNRYDLTKSTSSALNVASNQVFVINAATNPTITISNTPSSSRSMTVVVKFNGAGTVTWPATIDWSGGSAPDLSDSWTTITLLWDGSTWTGYKSGGKD